MYALRMEYNYAHVYMHAYKIEYICVYMYTYRIE